MFGNIFHVLHQIIYSNYKLLQNETSNSEVIKLLQIACRGADWKGSTLELALEYRKCAPEFGYLNEQFLLTCQIIIQQVKHNLRYSFCMYIVYCSYRGYISTEIGALNIIMYLNLEGNKLSGTAWNIVFIQL